MASCHRLARVGDDDLAIEALGDELDASSFDWCVMKWSHSRPRWRVVVIDPAARSGKDEVARYDDDRLSNALRQAVAYVRLATIGPDSPSPLIPEPTP